LRRKESRLSRSTPFAVCWNCSLSQKKLENLAIGMKNPSGR